MPDWMYNVWCRLALEREEVCWLRPPPSTNKDDGLWDNNPIISSDLSINSAENKGITKFWIYTVCCNSFSQLQKKKLFTERHGIDCLSFWAWKDFLIAPRCTFIKLILQALRDCRNNVNEKNLAVKNVYGLMGCVKKCVASDSHEKSSSSSGRADRTVPSLNTQNNNSSLSFTRN